MADIVTFFINLSHSNYYKPFVLMVYHRVWFIGVLTFHIKQHLMVKKETPNCWQQIE